jgi:hypothetical protein
LRSISEDKKQLLEIQGYAIVRPTGGQPRKTYYTPDGRKIRAIPCMREYQATVDGVIETGERDANYDKGWLDRMPTELKLYCRHCDKWHDTEQEIEMCAEKHKKLETWGMQQARRMHPQDFETVDRFQKIEDRVGGLESGMNEILGILRGKSEGK